MAYAHLHLRHSHPRHCERRCISEAIHTASSPRRAPMDCHASIKPFEARNDVCPFASPSSAPRHCERLHISEAIHTLKPTAAAGHAPSICRKHGID